jgi:Mrp family chromosome partitioning ATPase
LFLTAVIVTAAGAALYAARHPTYTATSRLLLRPGLSPRVVEQSAIDLPGPELPSLGPDLSASSEAAVLASPVVAARVARTLGLTDPPDQLSQAVTAHAVTDTLIEVQASSGDPRLAARLADGFADEYLRYRRESAARIAAAMGRSLDRRTTQLRARIAEDNAGLASDQASGTRPEELLSERDDLLSTVSVLEARGTQLNALATLRTTGGDVIAPAALPGKQPGLASSAVLGALLGGVLGSGLVALRGTASQPLTDLPQLIVLPWSGRRDRFGARVLEPALVRAPASAAAQTYRTLHRSLAARGLGTRLRRLLVAPVESRAAAPVVAADLAIACAQAGSRTILVSAGSGHTALGIPHATSLDAVVQDDLPWLAKVVATEVPGLLLLPCDRVQLALQSSTVSSGLRRLLGEAATLFEVVLVEAPWSPGSGVALTLAESCDAALLVATEQTPREVTEQTAEALDGAAAPVLETMTVHPEGGGRT